MIRFVSFVLKNYYIITIEIPSMLFLLSKKHSIEHITFYINIGSIPIIYSTSTLHIAVNIIYKNIQQAQTFVLKTCQVKLVDDT